MELMARSQAAQLRTTLEMLMEDDDLDMDGAPSRCARHPRQQDSPRVPSELHAVPVCS